MNNLIGALALKWVLIIGITRVLKKAAEKAES